MTEIASGVPYSDPEYVDLDDIQNAQRANRIAEHINHIDACNVFRAKIFMKLKKHAPDFSGAAIATFRVDSFDGSVATLGSSKEILLISALHPQSPVVDGHSIPIIRLFSQEWIGDENGNGDFVCVDMSLDGVNDAQYYIGGSHYMDSEREALNPTDPTLGVGEDCVPTWAPLTFTSDPLENKILVSHPISFFTDAVRVYGLSDDGSPKKTRPFGHWDNFADKIQALNVGEALFAEIENVDPMVIQSS